MIKSKYITIYFILLTLLFSGCLQENKTQTKPKMEVEVGTYTIKTEQLTLQTELAGRTKATLSAEIRPQVSGIIQSRLFQEGTYVKKGELLYQIDPSSYQATYDESKATLKNAEVAVETAKLKSERYRELLKVDGVSTQDAEDAKVSYLQAVATVEEKKAALQNASINLEHTKIKAPISGFIGISSVTAGTLVSASQTTALSTIRSFDSIYVDMSQSSIQLLKLRTLLNKQGMSQGSTQVTLKLEDGSLYPNKGELQFKEIAVDESTGTVTLRATFPNPNGILLPGMYVRAIIDEAVNNNSILVPQQAVIRDPKGNASVFILTENSIIEKRQIDIDRAIKDRWLVTQGLNAGDKIVVEGISKIRVGDKVRFVDVSQTLDKVK